MINLINLFLEMFVHIDKNLVTIVNSYGIMIYPLLFLIIFAETGLVVMPFLPGDSLLFAAGALAALGSMNIILLFLIITVAAILGDTLNYWIGYHLGSKVFREKSRFFKKEYLIQTQAFYEKHGVKTIVLARFIPIIRTFAPFIAGIGKMNYSKFIAYNVIGGISWVALFIFGGYYLGSIPLIKNNFSIFILLIIFASISPILFKYIKHKINKN